MGMKRYRCKCCGKPCEVKEEPNVIVTVDMSGAELRILAELAKSEAWIRAFAEKQDVHSIGAELLYPQKWPTVALPECSYYKLRADGTAQKLKCKCPEHVSMRDGNKAVNFMIVYGGGPPALADTIDVSLETAKQLLGSHKRINPDLWAYLDWSGNQAKARGEARTMYGRRRLLTPPTPETAAAWFIEEKDEELELPEEQCEANIEAFTKANLRKPNKSEEWELTHSAPSYGQICWAIKALTASRERQGKNHCIQGTNADIIKRAMGCGRDKDGKGYLWHLLPTLGAKLLCMVHDELIIHCSKKNAQQVAEMVADAFRRAAAEVMKHVVMEAEFHIAGCWQK
jgi:DNA polymerase I